MGYIPPKPPPRVATISTENYAARHESDVIQRMSDTFRRLVHDGDAKAIVAVAVPARVVPPALKPRAKKVLEIIERYGPRPTNSTGPK